MDGEDYHICLIVPFYIQTPILLQVMFAVTNSFSLVIRTPLHCAASCNNVHLCKLLVESGAAIFATTISDVETAADKCEEMEEGYVQCSQFLYGNINSNY